MCECESPTPKPEIKTDLFFFNKLKLSLIKKGIEVETRLPFFS